MAIPTYMLRELTRQRIVEELEDIEREIRPMSGSSGGSYLSAETVRRISDLRQAVERLGVTEAQ